MARLAEKLREAIDEIGSVDLRDLCAVLLLHREASHGDAADEGKGGAWMARALAAAFCAKALCRTYEVPEAERDLVLAVSLCYDTVAASEPFSFPEQQLTAVTVVNFLSIVERLTVGGAGLERCRQLLHEGVRAEILVALSFLLRYAVFSMQLLPRTRAECSSGPKRQSSWKRHRSLPKRRG